MKSFTRIKEINGKKYAYRITPYYDKETGNTKQKSEYLGRYREGEILPKRTRIPRRAFDYGELLPYLKIAKELPVKDILTSILDERQVNTILTLAFNRVVQPVSLCNVRSWYERTCLSRWYGDLPLASQSLSEFLEYIGGSSLSMQFSKRFIEAMADGSPLLYDITSFSSSSQLMDILEYGYNRDGDSLPQLNLSLVAHKDLGIPLAFDVYPGSIVDVTTLQNTIQKVDAYGLTDPTLILDRGFFSETNITELIENRYDFIMPASFSSKEVKSVVSTSHTDIEHPDHLVMYNKSPLFVKPVTLDLAHDSVDGYLFYDMKRERHDKSRFYSRLHTVIERMEQRKLRDWEDPKRVFQDIGKGLSTCLEWTVRDGGFDVRAKSKAVAQRVNRMGFTVILYRGEYGWKDVLSWSKERDSIEKMFMRLKNDLKAKPLRAHKTEVVRGAIFIAFLSLILQSRLLRLLVETDLAQEYSTPSLRLELSKLKMVELSNGSTMITEITKKQRDIFDKLHIDPTSCA